MSKASVVFFFLPKISYSESVEAPSLVDCTSESSSVTLEWRYDEDNRDHPAFITGYLVTVCKVQQDTPAGGTSAKLPMLLWPLEAPTLASC